MTAGPCHKRQSRHAARTGGRSPVVATVSGGGQAVTELHLSKKHALVQSHPRLALPPEAACHPNRPVDPLSAGAFAIADPLEKVVY
jgi:hypothetical protein